MDSGEILWNEGFVVNELFSTEQRAVQGWWGTCWLFEVTPCPRIPRVLLCLPQFRWHHVASSPFRAVCNFSPFSTWVTSSSCLLLYPDLTARCYAFELHVCAVLRDVHNGILLNTWLCPCETGEQVACRSCRWGNWSSGTESDRVGNRVQVSDLEPSVVWEERWGSWIGHKEPTPWTFSSASSQSRQEIYALSVSVLSKSGKVTCLLSIRPFRTV